VHDLQSSLARRTHGSPRFPSVRTERLLHLRACVGSTARDVVENGFPLLFGRASAAMYSSTSVLPDQSAEGRTESGPALRNLGNGT
jgi:hypothetical protein